MKRIIWKYGLLSGAVVALFSAVMFPLCMNRVIDIRYSEVLGYTTMVAAFIMVFAGVRAYREQVGGGTITFGKAFHVGILITLVTCAVYVVTWEIVYYTVLPDFGEKYAALALEHARAKGASPAALAKQQRDLAEFAVKYHNIFYNSGMTFMEIFPVGLIMTLISAGILRRREPRPPEGSAAVAG